MAEGNGNRCIISGEMKTLWIMRHAKSDWNEAGAADRDRTLTKRGLRDAPALGRWMNDHGTPPQLIISSPAVRAVTTARLVAENCGYTDEVLVWDHLYPGTPGHTIGALRDLDDGVHHVLIISHNPHSEDLVSRLAAEVPPAFRMPTAALARLELSIPKWLNLSPGEGAFAGLITPKLL